MVLVSYLLNVLGGFRRSPNEFIPVHKHIRTTRHSRLSIWNLPEEILLNLLKTLHVKELLCMKQVHSYFQHIIDNNTSVWASVSFQDTWPSSFNIHHFEKAANAGNIEALVKLAVAYLYNEGLTGDTEGKKVMRNGVKAAEMFCMIESLTQNTAPFTWLFIRPPWSLNGACCKECVFTYMKNYLKKEKCKKVQVCVAKTLNLLDSEGHEEEMSSYLNDAAQEGSGTAAYMLWSKMRSSLSISDKAGELESIRKLRDICSLGFIDAKLELSRLYAVSKFGGIPKSSAMSFIREFVHSVPALNTQECFQRSQELTSSMRYILVDWLAEVAAMKQFSTHTFHVAVSVVDRFLRVHPLSRSKLQLLGVASMVLCSRYLGTDIITIREAAWLTDNTYKYEDVVRMMGEITATLRGNLRVATSVDFAGIFNTLTGHDRRMCFLSQYICELALLQAEMGQYSPSETAASAILLSRLLMKMDNPWPSLLQEATGFCIEDLNRCAFHMHEKCFLEGSVVDHRDVTLQAVKQRYADDDCCKVSEIEIISYKELCFMLGVTHHFVNGTDIHVRFKNDDELIVSPSRKKRRQGLRHTTITSTPKTPRLQTFPSNLDSPMLNESVMSGYDGYQEDDLDESIIRDESIEDLKKELLSDEGVASESKDLFASLSSDNSRSPQKTNFSLSTPSPFKQCLSFTNTNFVCDTSTSAVSSSSQSSNCDEVSPSSPCASTRAKSSFINFKSTSMTLRSASSSGASGFLSSESESCWEGGASSRKRLRTRSPRHMTLRNTPKRKSRRPSGGRTFIFK